MSDLPMFRVLLDLDLDLVIVIPDAGSAALCS